MQHGDIHCRLHGGVEIVGGVAGHDQHVRTGVREAAGAFYQLRRGICAAVEQCRRTVGDVGVGVNEHVQVLLIGFRTGVQDDLLKQVGRGQRSHAAEDADDLLFHGAHSPLSFAMMRLSASTATLTAEEVSSLMSWSRPAASRS